jgi:hypothetical protein
MKPILLVIGFLFFTLTCSFAQSKIVGTVNDTLKKPLAGATVMLMQAKDSLLSGFALVNDQGAFEIPGIKAGNYVLQVSYLGFRTLKQAFTAEAGKSLIDVGTVKLEPQNKLLDAALVTGEREPMRLRKDTIEFNANAFQTAPNATVEDLIRKLPGIDVDKDGTVKAQGETVTRVLVNGKEFFGRDPKTATRNLPADAVDKVQVFDKQSDQSEFSGVDDGQREKTINLTLKKDRENGTFGTASIGGGDPKRFEGRANLNRFKKNEQLSFIGMANNTNKQGFSISEYADFLGGMPSGGGGGGGGARIITGGSGSANSDGIPVDFGRNYGFTKTLASGLNFNHEFSKKTQLNGSYSYSGFDKLSNKKSRQENFLQGSSYFQNDTSNQEDKNANHRLNFTLDQKIDSTQALRMVTRISYSQSQQDVLSNSLSTTSELQPRNSSNQSNNTKGMGINFNTSLLYRIKLNKRGRNFNTTFAVAVINNHNDGANQSTNTYFQTTTPPVQQLLNQTSNAQNDRLTYNFRASYTEPIKRGQYLEANYSYNHRGNDNNRMVYDLKTDGSLVFSPKYSNNYRNDFNFHRAGLNYRIANPKFNFTAGLTFQQAQLNGVLLTQETNIRRSFTNLLPTLRMRYSISQTKNLVFDYDTDINEPSITQLQPVPNLTNPLNIYQGNPNLRPEYDHNFNLRYLNFNQFNFSNIFAFVNFTYTHNRIQNTQQINDRLVTTSTPVNVPDDYRVISRFNYGGRIKAIKMRYSLDAGLTYTRSINFINDARNIASTRTPNTGLRLENQVKKVWDWSIGTRVNYSNTANSVNTSTSLAYFTYEHTVDLRVPFADNKFSFTTDLNYQQYRGLNNGFNQDIPIWGASFSCFFLKANKGQLKLAAFDILNKNKGISRQVNLNSISDQNVASLARYFLLSFTYSIKGFAKTNNNQGGIMRMFR